MSKSVRSSKKQHRNHAHRASPRRTAAPAHIKPRPGPTVRKRKSRRAILDDLHAKGIDRGTAAEAVEALFAQSEEDEEENPELANARALVERHYAAKLAQGKWQQVAAALARRGFSHSVIRQALADAETEETEA